jgi:hypothetical protein
LQFDNRDGFNAEQRRSADFQLRIHLCRQMPSRFFTRPDTWAHPAYAGNCVYARSDAEVLGVLSPLKAAESQSSHLQQVRLRSEPASAQITLQPRQTVPRIKRRHADHTHTSL